MKNRVQVVGLSIQNETKGEKVYPEKFIRMEDRIAMVRYRGSSSPGGGVAARLGMVRELYKEVE